MTVQHIEKWLRDHRSGVAKTLFALDALLGILSIGGAVLYGATYASGNVWTKALATFVSAALLWGAFCYGAYRGLTSENILLKCLFWVFVVGNFFGFPVGTATAGVAIWLWRDGRQGTARPLVR